MNNPPDTREVETRYNGKTRILVFSLEVQYLYNNGQYEEINCYEFNSELTEKRNQITYDQFIRSGA